MTNVCAGRVSAKKVICTTVCGLILVTAFFYLRTIDYHPLYEQSSAADKQTPYLNVQEQSFAGKQTYNSNVLKQSFAGKQTYNSNGKKQSFAGKQTFNSNGQKQPFAGKQTFNSNGQKQFFAGKQTYNSNLLGSITDNKTFIQLPRKFAKDLDIDKTQISIIGNKKVFSLGDSIGIRINLYKEDGSPRGIGGDKFKVRMFEDSLQASAIGRILDHGNGTHTAFVKCLWTGLPTIVVYFETMKEEADFREHLFDKIPVIRPYIGQYRNNETVHCNPFESKLRQYGSRDICNMTSWNGGMSFYCGKPQSGNQTCRDFDNIKEVSKQNSVTSFLKTLRFRNKQRKMMIRIAIKVEGDQPFVKPSQKPCEQYNTTKLWSLQSPIGYFYGSRWKLLHCTPSSSDTVTSCLRHKHLVIYGDSTARQWFVEIQTRFKCVLTTMKWTHQQWRRDSTIYCSPLNLTVDLVFHALPGNFDSIKREFNAVSRHILNFLGHKETIFLIQYHNHMKGYSIELLKDRMEHVRKSVERIVQGNPNVKIFLKGGHARYGFMSYRDDLFRAVKTQAFSGVRDNVIYLDNNDMTLAKSYPPPDVHPPPAIVSIMVDQMLAYIC